MDYILNLIFPTIILAIIVVTYYNYLLPFRFQNRALLILPVISIVAVTLFMRGMSYENMILNFAANSLSVMLTLVFFKDIVRGILYALIYEVVALLHDGLVYYVMDILLGDIPITTMPYFALSRIALVLLISASLLVIAKKLKSIQRLNIPKKYWVPYFNTPDWQHIFDLFYIWTVSKRSHYDI